MSEVRNKRKVILILVLLMLMFLSNSPIVAHADIGPKDSLTVYVVNPPQEEYYLDLLAQNLPSSVGDNLSSEERASLDGDMVALLFSLQDEGWLPALAHGTPIPMWGDLTGKADGGKMKHTFGYVGLPDTYRIIIVTKSGQVSISEARTRKVLQSSVTYDYKTGKISAPALFTAYLTQFLTTFLLTLLVEGAILLLFRYDLKKNWPAFLVVNLVTQIFMTLTVGITLIKHGAFMANFVLIPVELGILAAESTAYHFLLKGKSKRRNIAYGIAANLISWLAGFFLLNLMPFLIII